MIHLVAFIFVLVSVAAALAVIPPTTGPVGTPVDPNDVDPPIGHGPRLVLWQPMNPFHAVALVMAGLLGCGAMLRRSQ